MKVTRKEYFNNLMETYKALYYCIKGEEYPYDYSYNNGWVRFCLISGLKITVRIYSLENSINNVKRSINKKIK